MGESDGHNRVGHGLLRKTIVGVLMGSSALPVVWAMPAGASMDEIIVTATRRETTVIDVPSGVTALGGDYLEDNGFDSFSDYAGLVPSLDFVEFAPGQTRVSIRGVSSDPSRRTASTISVYIDDVPVTSSLASAQVDFQLFDIDRIEVLRGPQSTLFGENSMGGAIRIFTNEPDATQFEVSGRASIGSIGDGGIEHREDLMVNIPLVEDKLALRVVGSHRQSDGWIDNIRTGAEDVNSNRVWSGRASLAYTPNGDFSAVFRAQINRLDVDSKNETLFNSGDKTNKSADSPSEDDYEIYNLDIDWDLGFASLQSVTGFVHRERVIGQAEADISVLNINNVAVSNCVLGNLLTLCSTPDPNANFLQTSVFSEKSNEEIVTQEVRLVSPDDQRFRWILGGFFRNSSQNTSSGRATMPDLTFANNAFLGAGFAAGDSFPGGVLSDEGGVDSRQWAIFGEASFDIIETLEATFGLRTFREKYKYPAGTQSGLFIFAANFPNPIFEQATPFFDTTSSDTVFKGVLSWTPTDTQHYYASYSEGFRSGGANGIDTGSPTFEPEYDPDTTKNYEIGAKFSLFEDRLSLSTAAYYVDWKDLQIQEFDGFLGFTKNGGEAHVLGLEAEVAGQITDRFSFTFGGNLTEAETDSDFPAALGTLTGIDPIPSGARLPNVPHWSYGASIDYTHPLPNMNLDGVIRFDVRGQGDSYSSIERFPPSQFGAVLSPKQSLQDGYHIGNVRLGVENENWSGLVFVSNVWNEEADLGDNNFGFFHRNQPRTIGLTLSGQF